MVTEINKAWNWKGFTATEVIKSNDFGNVIFKTSANEYWRIMPEELRCDLIAKSQQELEQLFNNEDFIEDWEMVNLVNSAKSLLGELDPNQKYCLKLPAVIGGKYEAANLGKVSFAEQISLSGDLGYQIKDLKDGQKIKLNIKK